MKVCNDESRQRDRKSEPEEYLKKRLLAKDEKINNVSEFYSEQRKIRRIKLWFLIEFRRGFL